MQRLLCGLVLVSLPCLASARVTDTSTRVLNLSAAEDDATTAWRDQAGKVAVAGNLVHVLWTAEPSVGGNWRLMYARSTDGGQSFSQAQPLAPTTTDVRLDLTSVNLAAEGDSVYVAYGEGWPSNLHFLRSTDGGQNWEADRILHTGWNHSSRILLQAQSGKVALAWAFTMDDAPLTQQIAVDVSLNGGADFNRRVVFSSTSLYRVYLQDVLHHGSDLYVLYSDQDVNWFSSPTHLYLAASHDDGANFLPRQRVSVDSSNGSDYAWGSQDAAYSPALALCDNALLVTWMNNDNPGGFDGWFASSLRVRRSTDGGATLASPTTLHSFPGSYQNGSHPAQETIACRGGHAVVLSVLNDGGGERARFWESTDSGASWGQGRDLDYGGWWSSLHFAASGALHLLNGGHGVLESAGGTLHGTTAYIPTSFWEWLSPMTALDAQGVVHIVGQAQTLFGNGYSTDLIYTRLAPVPAAGALDQALRLVKQGNDRKDQMQVGATPALPGDSAFTVELWVKPDVPPSDSYTFIKKALGGYDSGSSSYSGTFELVTASSQGNRWLRAGVATTPHTWLGATDLQMNRWSHLALVYDPAAGSACSRLYVDGALVTSGDTCGAVSQDLRHLTLGDDSYYSSGTVEIDDVMIWHSARTVEQIAADMVSGATGAEAELTAYWSLDGTTRDLTGHGHDGVLLFGETFVTSTCTHAAPQPVDAGAGADAAATDGAADAGAGSDGSAAHDAAAGPDTAAGADSSVGVDTDRADAEGGGQDGSLDANDTEPLDCACRGAQPSLTGALALLATLLLGLARRRSR